MKSKQKLFNFMNDKKIFKILGSNKIGTYVTKTKL